MMPVPLPVAPGVHGKSPAPDTLAPSGPHASPRTAPRQCTKGCSGLCGTAPAPAPSSVPPGAPTLAWGVPIGVEIQGLSAALAELAAGLPPGRAKGKVLCTRTGTRTAGAWATDTLWGWATAWVTEAAWALRRALDRGVRGDKAHMGPTSESTRTCSRGKASAAGSAPSLFVASTGGTGLEAAPLAPSRPAPAGGSAAGVAATVGCARVALTRLTSGSGKACGPLALNPDSDAGALPVPRLSMRWLALPLPMAIPVLPGAPPVVAPTGPRGEGCTGCACRLTT